MQNQEVNEMTVKESMVLDAINRNGGYDGIGSPREYRDMLELDGHVSIYDFAQIVNALVSKNKITIEVVRNGSLANMRYQSIHPVTSDGND